MKSTISSTRIQSEAKKFQEEGLLQANVQNYGDACIMTISGISRPLPPPHIIGGVPVPEAFKINDGGREIDITISFDFQGNPGNIIIDYSKPKTC